MSDVDDLYQEMILDHYRSPRNCGALESPDRKAEGYNPLCGDRITVYLRIRDGVIEEATFEGSGCAISTASASLMTQSIKGKTVEQARALFERFHGLMVREKDNEDGDPSLGKLVVFAGVNRFPARVKCATLSWHTALEALDKSDHVVSTE